MSTSSGFTAADLAQLQTNQVAVDAAAAGLAIADVANLESAQATLDAAIKTQDDFIDTLVVDPVTPPPVVVTPPPVVVTPPPVVVTPPPVVTPLVPYLVAGQVLEVPTNVEFNDGFVGHLDTSIWTPTWFGNKQKQNATTLLASNVSVTDSGLTLALAAGGTGALVSSNPGDGIVGHTGFQIAPTATKPVYFECQATFPAAANGQVANWPAIWFDGQVWPEDGEIDFGEGLSGDLAYHIHYGTGQSQGSGSKLTAGEHIIGGLWTVTGVTFVYDGVIQGTDTAVMTAPQYTILENSLPITAGVDLLEPAVLTIRRVTYWQ
jgi:hypothetical protein